MIEMKCYVDDAKQFYIKLTNNQKDCMHVTLGENFSDFSDYLYLQTPNGETIHLGDIHGIDIPFEKSDQHCKIIVKDKSNKTHVLVDFTVPSKSKAPNASFEGKDYAPVINTLPTFAIKTVVHTQKLPEVVHENAHQKLQLKTDLHSHFAAAPTADDLLNIATKNGRRPFYYPTSLLKKIGVQVASYKEKNNSDKLPVLMSNANGDVSALKHNGLNGDKWGLTNEEFLHEKEFLDINALNEQDKQILRDWMSIPTTKLITFDDMEDFYIYREPFIKNIDFLEDLLTIAAKNYHDAGVEQASLSFSARICKPEWLAVVDRVLPQLEKEYGVKLRFLVGMSRLLDNAQQEDIIQSFKAVAQHPSIEGVDVFASEINSTYDFYLPLAELGHWCRANDHTDKVIRIHAGETPYHPENVGAAIRLSHETGMHVRIGHGLFGCADDESVLAFIKENKLEPQVIFEMCPDSNYALNHLDNTQDHAMMVLAKEGVPIVLGSDGPGLYYTDAKQLAKNIDRLPIETTELDNFITHVRRTEKYYLDLNRQYYDVKNINYESKLEAAAEIAGVNLESEEDRERFVASYFKEEAKKYSNRKWTTERSAAFETKKKERQQTLQEGLLSRGVTLIPPPEDKKVPFPGDKIPIMLTGGFSDPMTGDEFRQVAALIATLRENCDSTKVCFVTTGNDHGIQKMIHEELKNSGFDIVGLVAKNARLDHLTHSMTHAVLGYEKWYDMHGYVGEQIEKNPNFKLAVIGGNMLTRHIIQTGFNVVTDGNLKAKNNQLYLVKGIEGAADDKANYLPPQFSVEGTLGLIKKLHEQNIFKAGMSAKEVMTDYRDNLDFQNVFYEKCRGVNSKRYKEGMFQFHGDTGAVDTKDRTNYFLGICASHQINLDEGNVRDFFERGCPADHPLVTRIAIDAKASELIKSHFRALQIPRDVQQTLTDKRQVMQDSNLRESIPNELKDSRPRSLTSLRDSQNKQTEMTSLPASIEKVKQEQIQTKKPTSNKDKYKLK